MNQQTHRALRKTIMTEDLRSIIDAKLPWSRFDGATVLVTGANGFLGSTIVDALLLRNETVNKTRKTTVLALARSKSRTSARFAGHSERSDLRIVIQDVITPFDYHLPIDFVIHAASNARPQCYWTDPVGTHIANTLGTYNLLKLASQRNCQSFLYISSGDVYGVVPGLTPLISEQTFGSLDPMEVRSCYGESKRAAENLCACWAHQNGLPAKVARLSHTYGPGVALDDGRVFADFVARVVEGKDIVLTSDGAATRPFCYVTDAVIGLFTILLLGSSAEAYNLANDEATISIAQLARLVAGCLPALHLKVVFDSTAKPPGYVPSKIVGGRVDTGKIRALGWRPVISPDVGFQRMVDSYR